MDFSFNMDIIIIVILFILVPLVHQFAPAPIRSICIPLFNATIWYLFLFYMNYGILYYLKKKGGVLKRAVGTLRASHHNFYYCNNQWDHVTQPVPVRMIGDSATDGALSIGADPLSIDIIVEMTSRNSSGVAATAAHPATGTLM